VCIFRSRSVRVSLQSLRRSAWLEATMLEALAAWSHMDLNVIGPGCWLAAAARGMPLSGHILTQPLGQPRVLRASNAVHYREALQRSRLCTEGHHTCSPACKCLLPSVTRPLAATAAAAAGCPDCCGVCLRLHTRVLAFESEGNRSRGHAPQPGMWGMA